MFSPPICPEVSVDPSDTPLSQRRSRAGKKTDTNGTGRAPRNGATSKAKSRSAETSARATLAAGSARPPRDEERLELRQGRLDPPGPQPMRRLSQPMSAEQHLELVLDALI